MYRQIEDQFAYMAGFIEGDGSLVLYKGTKGTLTKLSVVQKERGILDYFQRLTGVGGVYRHQISGPHWGSGRFCSWQVSSGKDLKRILPKVIPYLFSSKKRKARLLLRFCQAKRVKNIGSRLPAELRKRRRHLMREWIKVTSEIKPITNPPISLLAGFVDSDGSIGKITNLDGYSYWKITVTQKDRSLLDYLREEADGIGSIFRRRDGIHSWRISNPSFVRTLNQYLKIKRKRI